MKKLTAIVCFLFIFFCQPTPAQDKVKFGTVTPEELEMTLYPSDTTASAVVLHEDCDVYYEYNSTLGDFQLTTNYFVRIKILKTEGLDQSNISIPFIKGSTRSQTETISGLTGFTYNMEGGKIQKEKLSKDYIFTEDITDTRKRQKFAMPAVKVGSVFEYKYTFASPYYYSPENYKFQRSIPVKYSLFNIKIPEYFIFNKEVRGYEPIKVEVKKINESFMIGANTLRCTAEEISAEVWDLPALKDEPYVWNYNDFRSGINFEITKVEIIGVYYKNYSQTWKDVHTELNESSYFGKQLNQKNLFKEDLPAILSPGKDDLDKIRGVLDLVRSKVKWNDVTTLTINNPKKALKEGIGTSGEINALLICALKDAGYSAYPIAMSLRSKGRIPLTYPTINNLNYFIVGVELAEKTIYLDATTLYSDINVIPIDCMVDKAFCVWPSRFDWVDLTNLDRNLNIINLNCMFNPDGVLSGSYSGIYAGANAYLFNKGYESAKDEKEYIEKEQTENDIQISNYKKEQTRTKTFSTLETYEFKKENLILNNDEVFSFNPVLFLNMSDKSFKSETRKLPVEFNYPYNTKINVQLTLPEGYVIDEVPQPVKYTCENGMANFSYFVKKTDDIFYVSYTFELKNCIVPIQEYTELRNFWSRAVAKTNEYITLKKKSDQTTSVK